MSRRRPGLARRRCCSGVARSGGRHTVRDLRQHGLLPLWVCNRSESDAQSAFFAQSAVAFGTAMLTMLVAIFYLPADEWPKAFLALDLF